MSLYGTGARFETGGSLEFELGADELVGALLGLEPARRLHLLDSGGARGAEARFLVAGFDPFALVESYGELSYVYERGRALLGVEGESLLSLLDARLEKYRVEPSGKNAWPACGACFVTLSYDLARRFQRLRTRAPAAPASGPEPEAVLAFFDALVVHDYARGRTFLVGDGRSPRRLSEMRDELLSAAARASEASSLAEGDDESGASSNVAGPLTLPRGVSSNFTREGYFAAVGRVREHIFAGDIYQANLTQQLACRPPEGSSPERVFRRLRLEHPASFAAFVRLREGAVVSASPERFLRVRADGEEGLGRVIEAWPIKGTRPRGRSSAEDARLRAELLASEKDRAENVMIVDLMRNDLGRVCRYGTVEVEELCAPQEHPTLFHLVSKVRGRLRGGVSAGDLLRAAFPCGSITGAPKLRAMEILDEVETVARGFSMGSLGYFSFDGAADLNVAIRTITFGADGLARFNVGGGVVADSDPSAEYEETLVKARALLRALRVGEP